MNFRKIIAILAAALMLCTIIPMGAISVSAAAKLDNNFDDGTVGKFKCDSVDTIVNEGSALKWTTQGWKNLYASFSVSTEADYKVTFKMKAAAATAMEVKYLNGSWAESGIAKDTINVGTEWTEYSRIINTGSNNGLVLLFQCHKATDVYIDDVKVVDYIAPAAPDVPADAIYFEDFEADHSWACGNASASMEIIPASDAPATKAENGNYVVKHTIPASVYPYISDRNGISVQPNTDYIVSFDALNSSANWPVQVIIAENYWLGGAFVTTLSQEIKPSNTTWETYSFMFNTGDHNQIWLGAKSQWASTTVYFDNFYIAPVNGSVQNDGYLKNGNFEAGALEWLHTSNTEITADDTGAGQGNVITTNELGSGVHMFSQPATNLVIDHEYVLSFKVYSRSASNGNAAFWVQFPSAFTTWTVDTTLGSAKYNNNTPRINVGTKVGAWYDVNITFTAKAATAVINFLNYRANQGFYSFDDISITPKHVWADATCTAPKTCSVCGATEGEALGHNYVDGICGTCGAEDPNYVPPHTCNVVEQDRVEATCTTDGYISYACECGLGAYTETIPAKGHTAGAAADCENAQVCTVCGAELTAALGHDWADATCTAPKTCNTCGATEGDALGHTPGAAADCDSAQVCTVCGAELAAALGHSWNDATCTAPKTCSVCGATEGDALGHTPGAAADCDSAQVCTVCGAELVAALGHDWADATCTAPKTCNTCGATEGDALGHAYAESARTDATCGADGSVTYTCGNCGDSYAEPLPATGEHTYSADYDVDCDVCGAIREVETLIFGGKSAMEMSEGKGGLAFRFSVKADGVEKYDYTENTYKAESGSIVVDGVSYTLKYAGAVVTNRDLAAEELTITNAQDNGNKTILNIGANYLWDLAEDGFTYAIRVINIPTAGWDTTITARPYFVYENAEGASVVVYGDIQSGTYNAEIG